MCIFWWQNVYIFSGKMSIVLVEKCVFLVKNVYIFFGGKMCMLSVVKCVYF